MNIRLDPSLPGSKSSSWRPIGVCYHQRSMKRAFLQAALVLSVAGVAHEARANAPALPGYTGLPNSSGVSSGCNNCHNGGGAPTLNLTGPANIVVGTPASYTLQVNTGAARGQGVVAIPTSAGTITAVSGFEKPFPTNEELTALNTSTKTYQFTINAKVAGSFSIYYAGLAANGNGTGGDGYARNTMMVTATGGTTPTPDSGTNPGRDSGTNPGFDSGTPPVKTDGGGVVTPLADGGSIVTFPDGATAPGPPSNGNGNGGGLTDSDEGGCNTTGGSLSLSGIFGAGAVATFLLGSRRLARRRRQT